MIAEGMKRRRAFFNEAAQFLRGSLRAHRFVFGIAPGATFGMIAFSLIASVAGFVIVWASARLVDELFRIAAGSGPSDMFPYTVALAIFSAILPDVIGTFRELMDRTFWLQVSSALEIRFAAAKFAVDIAIHESPEYQDSYVKATERGIHPLMYLVDMQYAALSDLLSLVISSAILWRIDPIYVLLLVVGVAPRLLVGIRYGRDVWGLHDMRAEDRRRFYFLRRFPDTTDWLMESHLLGLPKRLVGRMKALADDFLGRQLAIERKKALFGVGATLVLSVIYASVYGHILGLVFSGVLTVGGFIFATGAFSRFADPLQRILLGVGREYEHWLFTREIFSIMDRVPALPVSAHPVTIDPIVPIAITFDRVSFRYPNASENALSDVSFAIAPGQSFALVGLNGAGKTTLVKLLCRFYDPTGGRILVNGTDLREIDRDSWYRALAVLFQHFPTYESFTAAEGIALGDASIPIDRARVDRAARASGADDFIKAWPAGMDRVIGRHFEGGVEPSRGQEQRLALARMFYRQARCVLLDEPTAAVDAESEAKIFGEIEDMKGVTRIMISHRFSTVRHADQICVLKNGAILEIGDHAALMKKDGEYARLFQLQAKGYQDERAGPGPVVAKRKRSRKAA